MDEIVILASKADRRLVLFYLANDVLQNSRKKGKEFSNAFTKILRDAMLLLRFVLSYVALILIPCLERSTGISNLFTSLLLVTKTSNQVLKELLKSGKRGDYLKVIIWRPCEAN